MLPANDNAPLPARRFTAGGVPIIGFIGEGGRVTFTDPDWRPAPQPSAPSNA